MVSYILAAVTGVLVLVADQFTKYYIPQYYQQNELLMGESIKFIPKVLDITYIHNDGAAWGMLGGYTWLLLSITFVVILAVVALLLRHGTRDKTIFWASMLILSGGVGNMIDRIFRGGYVIDFLHFEFWPTFPVFNVADCAIVVGTALVIFSLLKSIFDEQMQKSNKRILEQKKSENQYEDI